MLKSGLTEIIPLKALFESAPAIKHRETKRRGKLNSLGKDVPDGAGGRSLPRRLALSPPGGGHSVISCLEGHTHTHTHTHTHPSLTSLYMYLSVLATLLKQHPNNAHTHTHTHPSLTSLYMYLSVLATLLETTSQQRGCAWDLTTSDQKVSGHYGEQPWVVRLRVAGPPWRSGG